MQAALGLLQPGLGRSPELAVGCQLGICLALQTGSCPLDRVAVAAGLGSAD